MRALNRSGQRSRRVLAGFSLIEVLIAVIILGLGLLGLGAVFPVVLRQQRIAGDAVNGAAVASSAIAQLSATSVSLSRAIADDDARSVGAWRLFAGIPPDAAAGISADRRALGAGWDDGGTNGAQQQFEFGQWWIPEVRVDGDPKLLGAVEVGLPDGDPDEMAMVSLRQRLFPADARLSPLYVWDIAVQRKSDFNIDTGPDDDDLRVVVFVRRLDPRIRVDRERSLRELLLSDLLSAAERRSPVGVDADGLPTQDGTDGQGGYAYSLPMTASVSSDSADRGDWWSHTERAFEVVSEDDADRRPQLRRFLLNVNTRQVPGSLLGQPGQRFVDNLGNVYTVEVVEPDPDNANRSRLRITPELSLQAIRAAEEDNFEVVFTPQIPAAVQLLELPR